MSAANRRAQFQASRAVETLDCTKSNNRPRILSAPIRNLSFDDSNNTRAVAVANKANRKLRRRRVLR